MNYSLSIRLIIVCCLSAHLIYGQVNGYAEVTSISGSSFAVTNADETNDAFAAGEQVIIMQMQDNVIGTTSNTSGFGDLGSIESAGLYEIRVIDYVVRTGSLDSVIMLNTLNNTYNINSNASVQLITFPTLDDGGGDYTTTANISAVNWDGNIGGVVAFNVNGTLTLSHNIDADEAGFIGALSNAGGSASCMATSNYRVTTQGAYADKGEGIFNRTAANQVAGRAKILNGGGGGNSHNGGGGGGGNYTAGGDGGPGYNCTQSAGGMGGIDLSASVSASRVFMGGGGGSGEGNNGAATGGGDGGGIVLIKANTLETTGTCGGRTITANGESITSNSSNDGSGGGGAGGSIVLQIDNFSIAASCALTIEANGGDGGNVGSGVAHGGGGGGGQGVVIYSSAEPTTNVTTNTSNGSGGCNNNNVPCTNQAPGGSGADGTGVIENSAGPLPIDLLGFDAIVQNNAVFTWWIIASEINHDYFEIQRSVDLVNWKAVGTVGGAENSRDMNEYSFLDYKPVVGYSYYRLKQIDNNGEFEIFEPVAVHFEHPTSSLKIFPVPVGDVLVVSDDYDNEDLEIKIYNVAGKEFIQKQFGIVSDNNFEVDVSELPGGMYFLKIIRPNKSDVVRFYKE